VSLFLIGVALILSLNNIVHAGAVVNHNVENWIKDNMNKETLYMVRWQQKYPEWLEVVDKHYEMLLEYSDMKEAKEVIERIKNGNNR
jgi:hypothetical protein